MLSNIDFQIAVFHPNPLTTTIQSSWNNNALCKSDIGCALDANAESPIRRAHELIKDSTDDYTAECIKAVLHTHKRKNSRTTSKESPILIRRALPLSVDADNLLFCGRLPSLEGFANCSSVGDLCQDF
ncbi:hypothetical protein CEXT_565261 [Caerostris extrusa]|uniref:Uncharacterized protein n=1 Tax=Caerostris extrusa TaxID=172846 RepID=A0AAV4TLC0_CAEEX|nr:hypothetical protein CEXT_565261 [Caerostris extrusa]